LLLSIGAAVMRQRIAEQQRDDDERPEGQGDLGRQPFPHSQSRSLMLDRPGSDHIGAYDDLRHSLRHPHFYATIAAHNVASVAKGTPKCRLSAN
jgi:hypothetical protein